MPRGSSATVRVTLNFERNLDDLEAFLRSRNAPAAFEDLRVSLGVSALAPVVEDFQPGRLS